MAKFAHSAMRKTNPKQSQFPRFYVFVLSFMFLVICICFGFPIGHRPRGIMQNKPNLQMAKMNISVDIKDVYGKMCPLRHEKNEANFQKPKMSSRLERSGIQRSIVKQSFDRNYAKRTQFTKC